jgi:hypothetical protein
VGGVRREIWGMVASKVEWCAEGRFSIRIVEFPFKLREEIESSSVLAAVAMAEIFFHVPFGTCGVNLGYNSQRYFLSPTTCRC